MTTDPKDSGIAASFLQLYLDDRRRGAPRSLMDYLRRFPGHEAVIAREYLALEGGEDEAMVDGPVDLPQRLGESGLRDRGRYRDAELVGRGGMGEVYRVWDRDLERTVAMKVLAEPWQGLSARRVRRFVDEMRVTSRLSHPGIVPVHDLGLDGQDRLYFTMPLIEGQSLREVLERRAGGADGWSLGRIVGLLVRVAQAVAFAHSHGVVHRDLKPANVMVGPFGESYVLDWGVARISGRQRASTAPSEGALPRDEPRSDDRSTLAGDVLGTPSYMAPEQAEGSLTVGPAADVYALGAILYHALAGRPPYADSQDALAAVCAGPPPLLRTVAPRAPAALVSICERAMARRPEARYASAEAFAEDLQAFLDERVVQAHGVGPWARAWSWIRRHRTLTASAAVVVAITVAAFAVTLRERAIADERARVARQSLGTARKSIWRMLGHMASAQLVNVPAMDEPRRAMLAEALALTRELRQIAGSDPEIVREVAQSQLRLGTLEFELGNLDAAAEQLAQAFVDFAAVGASVGLSSADREGLVSTWNMVGAVASDRGDAAGARRCMEACRRLARRSLDLDPDNIGLLESYAVATGNLAAVAYRSGDNEGFLRLSRERIDLAREVVEREPTVRRRRLLARAEGNLAFALTRGGGDAAAEGEALHEAAIARLRALLAEQPEDREVADSLADLCNRWGTQLTGRDDARAAALLEESIALRRGLVAAFPDAPRGRGDLGGALSNLSDVCVRQGRFERVRSLLEEAVRETSAAASAVPESPVYARYLRVQFSKLATQCRRERDPDGILDCARGCAAIELAGWESWLVAARCVAMALEFVAADRRPELEAEMLAYLARAREEGLVDAAALSRGFEAMAGHAGFDAFVRGLQGGR